CGATRCKGGRTIAFTAGLIGDAPGSAWVSRPPGQPLLRRRGLRLNHQLFAGSAALAGMEKFAKPVALITGANKGLGLEIARQLGQKGIVVVLGARQGKAEAPAAELRAQGLDARAVELDVTNAANIAALPAFFASTFGRLDILVNNAGVQLDTGFDTSPDTLRQVYEA
nr:hypothetical protein [Tanacetum cinerariifolium]